MTKSNQTQEKSKKSQPRAGVLSMSKGKKEKVNLLKNKKTLNSVNTHKVKSRPKTSGISDLNFGQIIDTTKDVVSMGSRLISGDPTALLSVPNSILKVVDTVKGTVDALSKDNAPKVVVDNVDVKSLQNQKVIETLKKHVPVINTTSMPSVFANEMDLPPIKTQEITINGSKALRVSGNSMLNTALEFHPTSNSAFFKAYSGVINPYDFEFFGQRVVSISANYQKWRMNHCVATFLPGVGTDVPGNVHLSFVHGTSPTDPATIKTAVAQREHYKPSSVYNQTQLAVRGTEHFLWISRVAEPTEQIKFFANQQFEVWTDGNNIATGWNRPVGTIILAWEIDLLHPMETPLSFLELPERRLAGHWITNYMTLDYTDHMKFLRYLTNKLIVEIISTDPNILDLGRVKMEKLLSRPYNLFKLSTLKQKLRVFSQKILDDTDVFYKVKEGDEHTNHFSYLAEVIKLLNKKYFKWIFTFLIDGYLENFLITYVPSENEDFLDFFVDLLRSFSFMVRYAQEKYVKPELDIDDEIDNFELTTLNSDDDVTD